VAEPILDEVSSAEVEAESVARASRAFRDIEIDGHLNELDWQNATPIGKFVQIEPAAGQPMTQPTEVRILFDGSKIYFGFTCIDSEMSQRVANRMRRDSELYDNDNVFILLDTYNDGRSGFFFRINPLGAIEDIAIMDSGDSPATKTGMRFGSAALALTRTIGRQKLQFLLANSDLIRKTR